MANIVLRTKAELDKMRKAGLLVWKAHQIASEMVVPGVTTLSIDLAVEDFFVRNAATPLFKGVPGKVPFPAVTCISINEEVVHGIPGSRRLVEGDVVSIDTGCRFDGWCGDAACTYPVGKVSVTSQKLLDVTSETLDIAIHELPACKYWSDVATKMADYVRKNGFFVVEDFVGHGIGREMHEEPQVPNYSTPHFRRTGDFRIQPGLVIAVEPMVNVGTKKVRVLSDHWTQVTTDRKPSAHFEHTIAVTDSMPFILTGAPTTDDEKKWVDNLK